MDLSLFLKASMMSSLYIPCSPNPDQAVDTISFQNRAVL